MTKLSHQKVPAADLFPIWITQDALHYDIGTWDKPCLEQDIFSRVLEGAHHAGMPGGLEKGSTRRQMAVEWPPLTHLHQTADKMAPVHAAKMSEAPTDST